ncbi:MAG: Activator of 2-hydroxyglutaryl-CoA dehydratase [Thermodesulfobacterium sp.]|uniref:Activator of 2-hydroxyglutaryl-CoA dehydratase n=1 Tax=Candidatus Thermodesulfobacterium syntrophicum TaxID=3060442 RepID=A0AAE3P0W7_9BACT|nr:Activator of 2-hydroxyglutaryl-CoA dehydratase [Candidatus Thermodesulfobacterium syntrophicum]
MKYVGLDVGSGTAKIAILDENKNILFWRYEKTHGLPIETAEKLLSLAEKEFNQDLSGITCTGTAGKTISQILGCAFINEVMAHAKAAAYFYPQVKTIIDIGGEDSKLIFITHERGTPEIEDFALNTLCAAGTGSFLEQQAARLGYTIEEFSKLALKAKTIPRIAGRCTVFAKSDMIHLQQAAVPDEEIIAGLCYAIIRNLKSNLAKGKEVLPPLIFQGGVAANLGVRKAVKDVFKLKDEELIIPEHFRIMGAIGAALYGLEGKAFSEYKGSEILRVYLKERNFNPPRHPVLIPFKSLEISEKVVRSYQKRVHLKQPSEAEVYIGIDVGSVSTKLVAIDEKGNLLAKVYMLHHGKPLESIKKGLLELKDKLPSKVKVKGVGTTGSGRYLIGDFVGADIIRNEITAQAYGALFIDSEVDTIFEIGGQDSKYIYLDKGTISNFAMNKACAAGTGSFLQEQAVKLGIPIEKFGDIALKSDAPLKLGERCTVFMQSDLLHYQQQGLPKEDLIAGLCYAIVYNYLNKVVEDRKIGNRIFFQGAVAFNKGVVAAFEKVLGKPVIVPPHHEVTGAIGVALLAKEEVKGETRFKGFDLAKVKYSIRTFECKGCPNQCEIHQVSIENGKPYYYGGRCEKYELDHRKAPSYIPNLTLEREEKLLSYVRPAEDDFSESKVIGIPRILQFFEWLPLFATLFQELGYKVVLSPPTSKQIIKKGCEITPAEPCFPIKIAIGHINALLESGIKNIFLPQITDLPSEHPALEVGKVCPYVQSVPWISPASIKFSELNVNLLTPVLHLGRKGVILNEEIKNLANLLGEPLEKVKKAWKIGEEAQKDFHHWLKQKGKEVLENFKDEIILVIVGRPYNAFDPGANLGIHYKIRKLGLVGLPVDMLPLEEVKDVSFLEGMYWEYGQRFLLAAHIIRETPNLFPIYFTNFSCGPDSFIEHFFEDLLGEKPFLEIEVDEHSAEAGIVTRLEAFVDSLKGKIKYYEIPKIYETIKIAPSNNKTIYIPYMCDHAKALAAAFRACGVNAQVLPEPDEESLELGRKFTSGKECYPTILTTGDLLKLVNSPDFNPEKSIFFMPDSGGPCRFGQYNRFHKKLLKDLGINMPVYSLQQDMKFYEDLDILGRSFMKIAWRGIVAVDILDKLFRETRPYAINKKEVEDVYWKSLKKIEKTIEEKGDMLETLLEIKEAFKEIDVKDEKKPKVGVVGEIYVRNNRFANENLYRFLEDLGLEVWLPPVTEWIYFINYTSKRWAKKLGWFKTVFRYIIESQYLKWEEKKFINFVKDVLNMADDMDVEELMNFTKKYVHPEFEGGEVLLSVGKAVEYLHHGASGIINVIPFACMPGNVVAAILKKIKEKEGIRLPTLTVPCDGQKSLGTKMRIEAFVEQVKEFFYNKKTKF